MLLKQLSIFVENVPGRLAEITGYFAEDEINLHALSLADSTDFGIVRLIVEDARAAKEALKKRGLTVIVSDVIAVALEHTPGSLHNVLTEITKVGVSIEYMYAFTSRSKEHDAMVILRLADQENALERIRQANIKIIDSSVISRLNEF